MVVKTGENKKKSRLERDSIRLWMSRFSFSLNYMLFWLWSHGSANFVEQAACPAHLVYHVNKKAINEKTKIKFYPTFCCSCLITAIRFTIYHKE